MFISHAIAFPTVYYFLSFLLFVLKRVTSLIGTCLWTCLNLQRDLDTTSLQGQNMLLSPYDEYYKKWEIL